MNKSVFLCSPFRTPIGSLMGELSSVSAPKLASSVIRKIISENNLSSESIDEVILGCVLTSGIGQAPARQAAIFSKLSDKTPCTTIGKVCGSGLKSIMIGANSIMAGSNNLVLAGGMENMSQAPHLLSKVRTGYRLGHGELRDSMIIDGLWDVYNDFHMGFAAEKCANKYKLSREQQDEYATNSYKRAIAATEKGLFKNEVVEIEVKKRKEVVSVASDEELARVKFEKFSKLKPVFDPQGTITAANASSINDGASAMLVASEDAVKKFNLKPFARIVSQAQTAGAPEWFSTAPATSITKLLAQAKLTTKDIDFWEINEAFAAVALANMKILELESENVNVRGGAIAMGHPIGASGARILTTMLHTLVEEKKKYGVASLCIGGGEAVSMLVENLR